VQEDVGAPRHLVLAKIGHDKFLAVKFVSALSREWQEQDGFSRIAANDQYQASFSMSRMERNRHRTDSAK